MSTTTTTTTTPGLFFVSSRITHPQLSEEIFHEWYNQRHIPDIFQTSGFEEAYRWKVLKDFNTSIRRRGRGRGRGSRREEEDVQRPFLNTYPLRDVEFLGSEEFKSEYMERFWLFEGGGERGGGKG